MVTVCAWHPHEGAFLSHFTGQETNVQTGHIAFPSSNSR